MTDRSVQYIQRSYQPRIPSNLLYYLRDPRRLINRLRVDLDFHTRKIVLSGMPYYLTVEPTNHCNLRCPLCFASAPREQRRKGFMSWETYARVVDLFSPYLVKLQLYNAGEPLLHDRIFDMVAYAASRKIRVQVSTNLALCTEEKARELVRSGLDTLVVSIDGISQESYTRYRVGGELGQVMENLRRLLRVKAEMKSRSPRILWSFLLFRHNLHELESARRLARGLGVDFLEQSAILGGVVPTDSRDPDLMHAWLPDESEVPRLFNYYSNEPFLNASSCPWPWHSFAVLWDGTIAPCCHVNTPIANLGHILDADLPRLWNAAPFQSARNEFRSRKSRGCFTPTLCSRCEIYRKPKPNPCGTRKAGF